jgi:hypothetical protein
MKSQWIHTKWRPFMAWLYFVTCIFDFIIFPIGWTVAQVNIGIQVLQPWVPLTIQGGGLYHLAMGAIVGITAWSRGKEKIAGSDTYSDYTPCRPAPPTHHMRYQGPSRVPQQEDEEL